MATETDFNIPPYNDDFDETKRFHRIMHRPSVPVQARELTQAQAILQNQIERFASKTYKDGSIVEGVPIIYHSNVHYISVEDFIKYPNGAFTSILPSQIDKSYLITNSTDSNNAVRATIKIAKDGAAAAAPSTNRFYLNYVTTGNDGTNDVSQFSVGDTLYIYNENQNNFAELDTNNLLYTVNTLPSNATFSSDGYAYCMSVGDGLIFQKGFFVRVSPQTITVRDFSTDPTGYIVGFDTLESIVTENEDESLYDNALGYPNENAPGAHRLKLTPVLISRTRASSNSTNFFAIAEFDGLEATEQKDGPDYSDVGDEIATRTYDESGDYAIYPFQIEPRAINNSTDTFSYDMSPGLAYIRGYRMEKISLSRITASKAITTEVAQNQFITGNYGNYVICNEFLGAFDTENMVEVTLYDAAQEALSRYEGTGTALSGSAVGKANVRAVVFEDGRKGKPEATYLLYLFNIRMNSGKSFSKDVKSIYSSTLGAAKADIVLENGIAVLKESTKTSLVFDTGLNAIKRLTNNTGVGDSNYSYNQIKTGTIQANGLLSLSIDTAAPGASIERLPYSPGTLSTSAAENFNIILSANAYTANLTGTISITSGSATITGTSTLFGTELVANDNIRISTNASASVVRRIVSVASNVSITVDAPLAVTNTTCNFSQYLVRGTALPLANVSIISNTSFAANFGKTLDASQTVYCTYPINRNQTTAIPKIINKNRFVKIDCSNNAATTTGPWILGLPDVHKIKHVYVGTTYANTNTDRASWFTLDNGQRDDMYDHARLVIKPAYASQINSSAKFLVELDHFTANTAGSVGFFSIESYPIDDANTASTTAIQTYDIPSYKGRELRNVIDFRPYKSNTAVSTATIASATINPVANVTSFAISGTGQYMILPDTNFEADFEYYLPRYDLIGLNTVGDFIVNQGIPSTTPRIPDIQNDQMAVATAYVPPYPSLTPREGETYKDYPTIKTNLRMNRRYTMKDIGTLDERIKRLEYYTVLNTLEQQARDLTIPDANGLNRFKNGIFADPFNSHNLGNVGDFEYKIAIDKDETVARPYFQNHDVDLTYVPSSSTEATKSANVVQVGPLVMLNYDHESYIKQNFATKFRNATESNWSWNGLLTLYPSYDLFRDEQTVPNTLVNLDLSAPWEQFANSPWGSRFGDWRTTATQITSSSVDTRQDGGTLNTRTTTTNTTQQRIMDYIKVDTLTQSIDLGSSVKDISISPYMRSRIVAFVSTNMKPRTTLHAFFDDKNVDEYCAPGVLSGIDNPQQGLEDRVVTQTGNFGDPLVSDASGAICGVFRIPDSTFRTGDRVFMLLNIEDLTTGSDAIMTSGRATYTADNLSVTKSSTTMTVRQPQISALSTTQRRLLSSTSVSTSFAPDVVDFGFGDSDFDPIAQSFTIQNIPDSATGIFLSKIGVFFRTKDSSLGCSIFICEMENNFPDQSRIIGQAHLPSSSINVARGPTFNEPITETQFVLEYPVYLLSNKEYAFIVQPDGNSPEYTIWVCETGDFDLTTNQQVFQNPYAGMVFVSANRKTWTPIQKEDIAFNLYRAKFNKTSGNAIFRNEHDEFLTVDGFKRANTSKAIEVGDYVYTVKSEANLASTSSIVSNTIVGLVGRIQYINEANGEVWLDSSTANTVKYFSNTTNPTIAVYRTPDKANAAHLTTNNFLGYANVISVDNLKYHVIVPKFGVMSPSLTSVSYGFKGSSLSNILDTTYQNVLNDNDYQFNDKERHVLSRSNEVNVDGSFKSSYFNIDLATQSDLVSPVINLSRKGTLFIENLINDDVTNEHTRYGNAMSRYLSKKVILKDGQEAEDLKVYLTAHRPPDTNIHIYAKVWNNEDPEAFDDKVWTKLQYDNGGELVYTSPTNTRDYIEYEFSIPSTNAVAYGAFANVNATTYDPIGGTISVANNSNLLTGTGTSFSTALSVGDRVRIVAGTYTAIRSVVNIANNTSLTLDKGLQATNSAAVFYAYAVNGNDGIVEYKNTTGSRFVGFKEFAIKIVLTSANPVYVPRLNDVRVLALQI